MSDITFIVFGATGHLARTKLIPAIARTVGAKDIRDFAFIGVGSSPRSDDVLRTKVGDALADADVASDLRDRVLAAPIRYVSASIDGFDDLEHTVDQVEREAGLSGNRLIYLAVPPSQLDATVRGISSTTVAQSDGWVRLVVEKPFGVDLATARHSNAIIHETFDESQVYRIDHFLGKETVRNLLVFRFTNSLFEQTWNRNHIASVEITVAEESGVDGRAGYFDESGTVRDMVQNHLTQILTLIAMEPPVKMDAASIHQEKVKVLNSARPITSDDAILGQYGAAVIDGEQVVGYRDEPGVSDGSTTPTFAAVRVSIDNWRWNGVPFYLRTGKRMSARMSQIAVRYHRPPVCLFHAEGECEGHQNILKLRLQPDEGFELFFDVKQPGPGTEIGRIPLAVRYDDLVNEAPDAYETLLTDVVEGDQTLFVRSDEVEAAWELYAPLLDRTDIHTYPAGTDGPEHADDLLVGFDTWSNVRRTFSR